MTETRELLGGTEENSVSPMRGLFFHRKETEKIELLVRPEIGLLCGWDEGGYVDA